MKIVAEVDQDFFDQDKDLPNRIYITFDKEGCKYLYELLQKTYDTNNGNISKLMSEEWGVGPLSSENYYEGAVVTDILEFVLIE